MGLQPHDIAIGCEPDLAIVLKGDFAFPIEEPGRGVRTERYLVLLVDREDGAVRLQLHSNDVGSLLAQLPP
jgi:hypothetical protein